jgi:hypothetical protein
VIALSVVGGLVLAVLLIWRRRRKAVRSAAVDAGPVILAAAPISLDGLGRHRAPATSRWFAGSGGAM